MEAVGTFWVTCSCRWEQLGMESMEILLRMSGPKRRRSIGCLGLWNQEALGPGICREIIGFLLTTCPFCARTSFPS